MPESTAGTVFDAFEMLDEGGFSPAPTWVSLLTDPKHLKGLAQIHVQAFRGRRGFESIAMSTAAMEDGGEPAPGDVPTFDAHVVAATAYDSALRFAKREGTTMFRLQLKVRVKKNGPLVDGEYATIGIDPSTGAVIGPEAQDAWGTGASKNEMPGIALAKMLWGYLEKMLSGNVSSMEASTRAIERAIELGDRLEQRRHEIEERAAEVSQAEAPEEKTKQWIAALQFGNAQLNSLVTLWLLTKMGPEAAQAWASGVAATNAPAGGGFVAPNQQAVQRWYENLGGDTHDALREKLGQEFFDSIVEAIYADAADWGECADLLRQVLSEHKSAIAGAVNEQQAAAIFALFAV